MFQTLLLQLHAILITEWEQCEQQERKEVETMKCTEALKGEKTNDDDDRKK